ncbi:MAG: fibronectin type III domain-containing protein [Lachnospiraceae bacterium]|nr:fibronectin type III domain-containing protein [Lachnospiraceae bacterium]
MKKRFILIICMIICMFVYATPAWASSMTVADMEYISEDGNWKYELQDGEVYLISYLGDAVDLIIPEKIDGYVVRGIPHTILFLNDYTLKSVTLPKTIDSVMAGAFITAYALEDIYVDNDSANGFHSVDGVLYNGDKLIAYPAAKKGESYVVPAGVKTIQAYAFYGCKELRKVVIPNSVNYIATAAFSRSKQPMDIIIKASFLSASYIDGACWEMSIGTRYLVKTEELKEILMLGLKDKTGYIDSEEVMAVDLINVPATSLTFTDGSTEQYITINYTDDGSLKNRYYLHSLYQQMPQDTTESVTWSLVSADTYFKESTYEEKNVCSVSKNGELVTYAGGNAILKGTDESGHEIILHVMILCAADSIEMNTDTLYLTVGETNYINVKILPDEAYANTTGVVWETGDDAIVSITETDKNICYVEAKDVGKTTITVSLHDNGTLLKKTVEVYVSDYLTNCTVDPIEPQVYVGEMLHPVPVVRYKGRILTEGVDYSVSYGSNNYPGEKRGWIMIEGLGTTFKETVNMLNFLLIYFDIIDGRPEGSTDIGIQPPIVVPPTSVADNTQDTQNNTTNINPNLSNIHLKDFMDDTKATVQNPKKPTKFKVKKIGNRKVKLSWKRNKKVTGYQIQYATNKKFTKNKKKITLKKNKKNKYTIKKLKAGKKYYFRVRAYKTVNGKKYYSKWSKVIKRKI